MIRRLRSLEADSGYATAAPPRAMRVVISPGTRAHPDGRRSQAGLPAAASIRSRALARGVFALLRMSVLTYFVE